MALKNMSLLTGATVAASGGSALAFADVANAIPNGVQLVVPADADYQTRRSSVFKYRAPTVDPKTGAYSKDSKSVTYVKPTVNAVTGKINFNLVRIIREVHPSLTAAECADLNKVAAQMLTDSDTDAFWATGSVS